MTTATTVHADQIDILHDAKSYHQQLLTLIATAKTRIYLCSLYLQHDSGGASIMQALLDAQQHHPTIDIKVFVDYHRARRGLIGAGKQAGNAQWYQEISAGKIPVYGIPVQTRELFGVLHLKGFVIDDCLLYSGASLNNVYLHVGERYRFDRYYLINSSPLANSFAHYLTRQLLSAPAIQRLDLPVTTPEKKDIKALRQQLGELAYQIQEPQLSNGDISITPICGLGNGNPFNRQIEQLLQQAQTRLTICTPYFNPPRSILKILQKQLRAGVRIEFIIGDKTANDFYIPPEEPFRVISALPYLYECNLRKFAKRNQSAIDTGQLCLRLWKHEQNSYHLKGIWVDEHWQLLTGNNLNPRAFRLDLENGLLIHDPKGQLAEKQATELSHIRQYTIQLLSYQQLQTLKDYPLAVNKLLRRLKSVRLDQLLNRLL